MQFVFACRPATSFSAMLTPADATITQAEVEGFSLPDILLRDELRAPSIYYPGGENRE
jgi:hypothetical protein